ncbi:MAG: hypothetical protein N2558_02395 [Patescibacteria group bacterium]|nr:hypothetical protein [Patescibacteria group bacterium]
MIDKTVYFLAVIFLLFVFLARGVFASEGVIELNSVTDDNHKCFVSSILMQDLNFLLAVTCRNLLYPGDNSVSKYSLWSVPLDNNASPVKLADLGWGRVEVRTNVPFKELYVVSEKQFPGQKSDQKIVMRGVVKPLSFLLNPGTPTPTPLGFSDVNFASQNNTIESLRDKVIKSFQNAGVAIFLIVLIFLVLIFVVFKSKG